ncbi:MAG: rhodanese-like domain-containing protein [Sphingobacteriales bacterium]|nr:MAG: rhodanese-like domain-containing protein [Sphingobacteriales bacterium]
MQDITVTELKHRLDSGEKIIIIDVREPHEFADFNIGGQLIPLGKFADHLDEFEEHKEDEIILYCRSGKRSHTAKEIMIAQGFTKPRNLLGGMLEWRDKFGG